MTETSTKGAAPPTLIVTGGPRDGAVVTVKPAPAAMLLGSGPTCHLRLELGNIDLVHARVSWDGRGVTVTDVGSAMGTYVNGEKVGTDHPLADGDRVCLGPPGSKGSQKLLVRIPAAGAAPLPDALPTDGEKLKFQVDEGPAFVLEAPHENPATAWSPTASNEPQIVLDTYAELPPATATDVASPPARGPEPVIALAPEKPRPDISSLPSIAPEREREPIALPPVEPLPKVARKRFTVQTVPAVPRAAVAALAALALGGLALWVYKSVQKPPPELAAVVPPKAEPGQAVSLRGTGFDEDAGRNVVRFGDQVAQVVQATATQLSCTVPPALGTGTGLASEYAVTVEAHGHRSNAVTFSAYRAPRVDSLDPDVALPGQEVTIRGQNLAGTPVVVLVGGVSAEIKEATPAALRVAVPPLPVDQGRVVNVNVQVGGAQARSAELVLGRLPVIIDFTPTRGPLGERVTLRGRGFAPDPKGNVVTFGGGRALIVSASTNELVFSLPPPASPRAGTQIPIAVQVGQNRTASQTPFFLIQTSSGVFIPRFFAAPVTEHLEHDHALVSTELGPLLLLTGPSGSTSVAERAMSAAAALNSVFDQEGAPPPRLEGRDDGIALAGRTELLVPLTPVDLEGYGEAWEGAPRRRIPARVLAPYGAALLEDFHVLFVQRQRPMKVLELSARGRALSEIYTETQRRSGPGAGVPVSLVRPPTASLARALREMALLPPADAGGRAAAAVEGVWEGSMDEAGLGSKPIRLRFRTDGAELRGFITTRSGGIALETGLQKVTYSRGGSLRFSLAAGGTVREFRGQLAGATLEGTIHDEGGADAGRFSLRFVE